MVESVTTEDKSGLTSSKKTKKRLLLVVIAASNFCVLCCVSLIAPFYAIEAAKKGVGETVIGVIYGCSEFVIFLTSPIIGYLLSKFSPRSFYIVGLWMFGICEVLFGWMNRLPAGPLFVVPCLVLRTVEALGTAAVLTSSFAIVGHTFPETVVSVYGILETVVSLGFMAGPAIGGGLYQLGGYGLPFWALGTCTVFFGCVSYALLPTLDHVESTKNSSLPLLRSPEVWFGICSIFVALFATVIMHPVYAEHLGQFNLTQSEIGFAFAACPAAFSVSSMTCGYLLENCAPAVPVLVAGMICGAIIYLFLGPAPFICVSSTLWLSVLTVGLVGLCTAPIVVSSIKYIFAQARRLGYSESNATFGMISGTIHAANYLGTFTGPLVGGVLTEHFGFAWAMTSCIPVLMLPLLLFGPLLLFRWRNLSTQPPQYNKNYTILEGQNTANGDIR
ncbi:MFS-type transporter SLC18B1-like [Haliotis rubra]|uniref:MFS-type transporter SLC18B1-like n=1 Tax=Haliotis rubra TaxID=36100 RepID=UPI001EE63528|nr:MFS-type transporter SLC18B1-like [Haliotis rubra]